MMNFFKWLILLGLLSPLQMYAQSNETARVRITVEGVAGNEGFIRIALFSSKASFPDQKPFKTYSHSLKASEKVEVTFESIPFGEYAVAVYHDKNGNNKLDTNFVGIPKEPYGFSNNHNPKLSAPDYDKAKVEIRQAVQTLSVRVD